MNTRNLASNTNRRSARTHAFTLIELLVVIGMVVFLMSMSLPGLCKTKLKSQGAYCMKNSRQLAQAWAMYASDNNDWVSPNRDGGSVIAWQSATANWTRPVPYSNLSWVGGWLDWAPTTSDNTNLCNLLFGSIGAYAGKNTDIYHCPADKYQPRQGAVPIMRVRSTSMNGFVGDRQNCRTTGVNDWYPNYVQFLKTSSFTRPGPAMTWLLVDEHPDSINDGWFIADIPDVSRFVDLPASYHNGAGGFAFCDGHSEIHKWHGLTLQPVKGIQYNGFAGDPGDVAWLQQRSSVRK